MLAAIVGANLSRSTAFQRLRDMGHAARLGPGQEWAAEAGALMLWPGPLAGSIDEETQCCWLGTPRGDVPSPEGEDLSRLQGDYCLVAFRRQRALLARGRFGGRPIYYGRDREGAMVICSRLAPLLVGLGRKPAVDCKGLSSVILTTTVAEFDRTVYVGVRRVPCGDVVVVSPSAIETMARRPLPKAPDVRTAGEAAEELRTRILRAVARATRGSRRVAVLAGGGVDSSAILAAALAVARGASSREVIAIALDFGGGGDDRPHLRALSRSLGIEPVRLKPKEFALGGTPSIVIDGSPFPWPTADSNISLVRKAKVLGADLVLSGALGDEIFGGDARTFAAVAMGGEPFAGLVGAATLKGTWLPTVGSRVASLFLRPSANLMSPWPSRLSRMIRRRRTPSWMGPVLRDIRSTERPDTRRETIADIISGKARQEALDSPMYHLDQSDYRAQLELVSGCARSDPFSDDEVLDFVSALPAPFLFHGGFHRGLLREAMRGLVPDSVRLRPDKASATTMMQEIFRAPGRVDAIRPLLSLSTLGALGLVDPRRLTPMVEAFVTGADDSRGWLGFWPLIVAEGFARRIIDGGGWSPEPPYEGASLREGLS